MNEINIESHYVQNRGSIRDRICSELKQAHGLLTWKIDLDYGPRTERTGQRPWWVCLCELLNPCRKKCADNR